MCIYRTEDGICKKHSIDIFLSYCVDGPCPDEVLTNADRIRAMSDEELAERIWPKFGCPNGKNNVTCGYIGNCKDCWLDWLRQTAEEN